MNDRMTQYYLRLAQETANLSRAVRLQVGAVIVTKDDALLYGWNGTPAGWDNECEERVWMQDAGGWLNPDEIEAIWPYVDDSNKSVITKRYRLKTKPEVLHAEANACMKLAKSTLSGNAASLFTTHSPCIQCAKLIYQAGIKNVYYLEEYKSDDGILFLQQSNVNIKKVQLSDR
jgi:dCMP deaminase